MNATVRVNFRSDMWLLDSDMLNYQIKVRTLKLVGDMPSDGAFLVGRYLNTGGATEIHAVPSPEELSRKVYVFHSQQQSLEYILVNVREKLGIEVEVEETEGSVTRIALNVMVQPVLFLLQNYILDMPHWFRFSPGDQKLGVDPRYSVAHLDPSGTKLMCATMSATSELKMNASEDVTFLELKLQLTTYNINAFSAAGSSFYDLVTGKMWLSPYAAEGDDGDCDTSVKMVVIDATDGMEDATDFLTSLELRLSKRSYLGYVPTTVPQYVKYHKLRTGVNLLSSFRGGDEENLYLAQVMDKGLDESTPGLATRVPTCLLSCQHPAKNFFRSRQDAPASLDFFVETIKQCSEVVKGVQDAMLVQPTPPGNAEPPSRDFSTFGGGSSPLKRASSLGSRAVRKKWVDEADSMDSLDM